MNVKKQLSKMNVRVIRQGKNLLEVRNHLFGQRNGRSKISDIERVRIALFVKNFTKNGKNSVNKACKLLSRRLPIGEKQIYNIYRKFVNANDKRVFVWEEAIVGVKDVVVKSAVKNPVGKADNKLLINKSRAGAVNNLKVILGSTNRKIAHKIAGNSPNLNTTKDLLKINWRDFSVRPQDFYGNVFELDKQFIEKINDKQIIKLEEEYIYLKMVNGMIGNLREDLAADLKYLNVFNKTFYKNTMKSLFGSNKANELETKFETNFDNVFSSYVSFFVSKNDIKDLISSYKVLVAGDTKKVSLKVKARFHRILFAIENKEFLVQRYLEQTKKLLRNRKKYRIIRIPAAV